MEQDTRGAQGRDSPEDWRAYADISIDSSDENSEHSDDNPDSLPSAFCIDRPLKRSEIIWILRQRREWWHNADSKLRNMTKKELLNLLDPEPALEELRLLRHRKRRLGRYFPRMKAPRLKAILKKRGVPYAKCLDTDELREKLEDAIRKGKTEEPELDIDQRKVVCRWDDPQLVINAGPGSGKTTTLCALTAHILFLNPDARVLILAFNRCARAELTARLTKRGVALLHKTRAFHYVTNEPRNEATYPVAEPENETVDDLGAGTEHPANESRHPIDGTRHPGHETRHLENRSKLETRHPVGILPTGCLVSTFDSFGFWSIPRFQQERRWATSSDYRVRLEMSATILAEMDRDSPAHRWDWVIVDEAQDLNDTHARIVNTLRQSCSHLVVAGDPRQEVYLGANWFSALWTQTPEEYRAVLRFNYRSAPEIVDVVNTFSRRHFPELHHDQFAARTDPGTVEFCQVKTQKECGEAVGERLSRSEPGESYAISPVTVKKFRTQPVTNTIRQVVHEQRPGSHTLVYGERNLPGSRISDVSAYVIGTSRGLKGTERNRVVIYGITAAFSEYGISTKALAKLMYVAISRAKDCLHIIADGHIPEDSPMACFPKFEKKSPRLRRKPEPARAVSVKDLAEENYTWSSRKQPTIVERFQPIRVETEDDADVVGLYLEAVVAHCAGFRVNNLYFQKKDERRFEQSDFYTKGDTCYFTIPKQIYDYLSSVIQGLWQRLQENPSYTLTVARRSLEIQRLWTISKRLEQGWTEHCLKCEPVAAKIRRLLGGPSISSDQTEPVDRFESAELGGPVKYQSRQDLLVSLHRSSKCAGVVSGVFDFSTSSGVAELKYVQMLTSEHRSQAAMYAAVHDLPHAFLVNLHSGDVEEVRAVRKRELLNLARAKLALKSAQWYAAFLVNKTLDYCFNTECIVDETTKQRTDAESLANDTLDQHTEPLVNDTSSHRADPQPTNHLPTCSLMNETSNDLSGSLVSELVNRRERCFADSVTREPIFQQMPLPPEFVRGCCIAVDVETDSEPNVHSAAPLMTEIGAVAFSMDGHVLGTFHRILRGVEKAEISYQQHDEQDAESNSVSKTPARAELGSVSETSIDASHECFNHVEILVEKWPESASDDVIIVESDSSASDFDDVEILEVETYGSASRTSTASNASRTQIVGSISKTASPSKRSKLSHSLSSGSETASDNSQHTSGSFGQNASSSRGILPSQEGDEDEDEYWRSMRAKYSKRTSLSNLSGKLKAESCDEAITQRSGESGNADVDSCSPASPSAQLSGGPWPSTQLNEGCREAERPSLTVTSSQQSGRNSRVEQTCTRILNSAFSRPTASSLDEQRRIREQDAYNLNMDAYNDYLSASQWAVDHELRARALKALRAIRKRRKESAHVPDPLDEGPSHQLRHREGLPLSFLERYSGLRIVDRQQLVDDQQDAVSRFHHWVSCVSGLRCFVHWSSTFSETSCSLLRLQELGYCQDIAPMYRFWLKQRDMERMTSLTLKDCVEQILGPDWSYEPHRAFEDAVAIAAVVTVLSDCNR